MALLVLAEEDAENRRVLSRKWRAARVNKTQEVCGKEEIIKMMELLTLNPTDYSFHQKFHTHMLLTLPEI